MKVYQFWYNPNTWESQSETISVHRTKEGAKKAMNIHKEETRKEFEEIFGKKYSALNFGKSQSWGIQESELLD